MYTDLSEGLEVGPSQADAALLALHILHLVVTSGQVSHSHLPSPVQQHQSRHEEDQRQSANLAFDARDRVAGQNIMHTSLAQ